MSFEEPDGTSDKLVGSQTERDASAGGKQSGGQPQKKAREPKKPGTGTKEPEKTIILLNFTNETEGSFKIIAKDDLDAAGAKVIVDGADNDKGPKLYEGTPLSPSITFNRTTQQ